MDEPEGGLRSCSGRDNCKDFGFYSKDGKPVEGFEK